MYILGKDDVDPHTLFRAMLFFLRGIDKHIKNTEHLSKETIKYYTDRILEITMTLEDCALVTYDEIDDEEKKQLELQETERNREMYERADGTPVRKGLEEIQKFIISTAERYNSIRAKAKRRVNNIENQEI